MSYGSLGSATESQKVDLPLFKVLVVGDLGCGKTSLIKRHVHNVFSSTHATIGVDFAIKRREDCTIQLWDIAGHERFGSMLGIYYRKALGAIVVHDITRPTTFEGAKKWKSGLDEKIQLSESDETLSLPTILVTNKIDLLAAGVIRTPTTEELDTYCRENGFIGHVDTSAKDDIGIDDAMQMLVDKLLELPKEIVPTASHSGMPQQETKDDGCCS